MTGQETEKSHWISNAAFFVLARIPAKGECAFGGIQFSNRHI